jgi:glucose-1-phosphate adenylyltransferase
MFKVMGLCNLHTSKDLGSLTASRPPASTSFLGRYAFMDFTLSNFSNSGIDQVGILVKNQPRSVIKHLGSTNVFNTNTKRGFQQIMYNEKHASTPLYNHDLNNIRANDWLIIESKPDIFVLAPTDILYTLDFSPIIKDHVQNGEKITFLTTRIKNGKSNFIDEEIVQIENNRVISMSPNRGLKDEIEVSLDTYIISKEMMDLMLVRAPDISAGYGVKDMIKHLLSEGSSFAQYRFTGYVRAFNGLKSYYDFSMEFLNYEHRKRLFKEDWPIYTVSHNTAPALYGSKAVVKNSIISNGAVVHGTVINSIISRNVYIAEGAYVENSIVFTDSKIMSGVEVRHSVIDKYVKIEKTKQLSGKEEPLYIKQGDRL